MPCILELMRRLRNLQARMRLGTIGLRLVSSSAIYNLIADLFFPPALAGASATIASDALMNPFDGEYRFRFLY